MKRIRLFGLIARLARAFDRLGAPSDDGLPIDPSLLPLDLATCREPR